MKQADFKKTSHALTQLKQVRNHLKIFGNITQREAAKKYEIWRLSCYIHILRHEEGADIHSKYERSGNKNYVRYITIEHGDHPKNPKNL